MKKDKCLKCGEKKQFKYGYCEDCYFGQDNRGKHGNQGRKKTGRYRKNILSARFTKDEIEYIVAEAKKTGHTQADFILLKVLGWI